jgi:hypothetical protein
MRIVFAPQAAGAAGLSPAFPRRDYALKEFAPKEREVGGRYRGEILYRISICLAPYSYRARRRDGEIPALKRRAGFCSACGPLQFGHFWLHDIVRFLARRACAEGVKDNSPG